jgi:2-(1,2-epoxy-1,2-dihydrophenyl)acetyl-CoA isomerase
LDSTVTTAPISVAVAGGIATVTFAAPDNGNAIGLEFAQALGGATRRCQEPDVRAVILTAIGRSFCVGGDLREFAAHPRSNLSDHLNEVTSALHTAIMDLTTLTAPVIASVHGNVAGAGVSLMCAADLVIASNDATFTLAYTAIGYTPDGGASWHLPRLVGHRRALELLLLNRRLTAAEALDWGLVTRVAPSDQRRQATQALATMLADGPTQAIGAAKRLAADSWTTELATALQAESKQIGQSATSPEGIEGTAAFLTKRRPTYRALAQS